MSQVNPTSDAESAYRSHVVDLDQEHACVVEALQQVSDGNLAIHILEVTVEDRLGSLVEAAEFLFQNSRRGVEALVV
jgi:hypothetical protein